MSNDKTYRKFDSSDKYRQSCARLTKDADVREGDHGKMCRLTFTSESRKEQHSTLWLEANICDFNSEAASFLLKGDIIPLIEGKPFLRQYTDKDGNERQSFGIDRAELVLGGELFNTLKTRGFEPGTKTTAKPATKATKPAGKAPTKAVKPAAKKPVPVEIPDLDDDEDLEIDDSDDE